MGCCETRDEKNVPVKPVKSKGSRHDLHSFNSNAMRDQDKMIVTEKGNTSASTPVASNTNSLRLYVEWCKNMKKWDELAVLIGDNSEIRDLNISFEWASKPRSVGSLSLVYLCIECQQNPKNIAPYVDSVILNLIKAIKSETDDFQENSMFLLYYFLSAATEASIIKIVKFNIFGVITKFLLGSKKEMRYLTAAVCARIYRQRFFAQEEFLNHNGGFKLVQLISLSKDEGDEVLGVLISNLIELIQDENMQVIESHVKRINDIIVWETLDSIDKETVTPSLLEKCDELSCLLNSHKSAEKEEE